MCISITVIGDESVPVVSVKTVPCKKGNTILVEYRDRTCETVSWQITLYVFDILNWLHQISRLRMNWVICTLFHVAAWCAQRQLTFTLIRIKSWKYINDIMLEENRKSCVTDFLVCTWSQTSLPPFMLLYCDLVCGDFSLQFLNKWLQHYLNFDTAIIFLFWQHDTNMLQFWNPLITLKFHWRQIIWWHIWLTWFNMLVWMWRTCHELKLLIRHGNINKLYCHWVSHTSSHLSSGDCQVLLVFLPLLLIFYFWYAKGFFKFFRRKNHSIFCTVKCPKILRGKILYSRFKLWTVIQFCTSTSRSGHLGYMYEVCVTFYVTLVIYTLACAINLSLSWLDLDQYAFHNTPVLCFVFNFELCLLTLYA